MRRAARTIAVIAAAALAAVPAAGQDLEMMSRQTGEPLPRGYYERVARDPDAFELQRGWRGWARDAQAAAATGAGPRPAVLPTAGNLRMVVLMTLFADSPPPPFATSVVQDQLFASNPLGTLTQFYHEISGGRVNLTGNVLPWVRSSITRARAVGGSDGLGDDADMGAYLRDVVGRMDATVNFGQYDNDGPDGVPNSGDDDGYVDVTVFQFTEIAASCGGNGVWPHRSTLRGWSGTPYVTNDVAPGGRGVMVDDYIIQSVLDCDGEPQNIATIAHETGHAFGLPDFYDPAGGLLPQQRRWVLGCWTLMAAGSWGCGDGGSFGKVRTPPHMGAFEKLQLGWIGQTKAEPGWRREYLLDPVQSGGRVLMVPLGGTEQEYLLLEYRPRTGFDEALPAEGVVVYHVEPARAPRPCATCARLYRVGLVEADGDGALLRSSLEGGDRGVAGDVFSGTRTLDDRTTPSILLNNGLSSWTHLEIAVADGRARVRVSTLPMLTRAQLVAPFVETGTMPTADEAAGLDLFGNRNGRYDVGDLRAYSRLRGNILVNS
jgi:M6 family metalloprotease-like protein